MPEEVFTFLMSAYDISYARLLVRLRKPDGCVSVREYYEGVIVTGIVEIDETYALSGAVRLDRPLIVGTFRSGSRVVLDGYHRIARAYHTGVCELPCYTLSVAETDRIRIYDQSIWFRPAA